MGYDLLKLVERARRVTLSDRDKEEQRRGFAYGNLRLEDDRVTRTHIDRAAESLRGKRR